MPAIPMQLVTGFLGSGKTTFLKNYLDEFSGSRKIGIIQNEFSEVNIDTLEIQQNKPGFEILEVNNGSVFCVCLLGSFVDSLAAFIDQIQPNELILEASGMSDPLSIGQILQSPALKHKIYLDHVWCLVDALNFRKISGLQTRVNHQIRIADTIVINKSDLAEIKDDELFQLIRKLNPFADIQTTSFSRISFESKKVNMKFIPPGENAENGRPDLESQVIKSTRLISPEKLNEFLAFIREVCIRGKGYINLTSGTRILLQISFNQITIQEVEKIAAPSEFVVLGNFPDKPSFQKLFDYYCQS
ncbi:MAG: GTP-binding protein [Prolixibacteraceae bacterium]|nr:GTP-binding protein [Prolixibacteraceae bacterium]